MKLSLFPIPNFLITMMQNSAKLLNLIGSLVKYMKSTMAQLLYYTATINNGGYLRPEFPMEAIAIALQEPKQLQSSNWNFGKFFTN
jgi:hypothetical protein